jgi:hypothetical protein
VDRSSTTGVGVDNFFWTVKDDLGVCSIRSRTGNQISITKSGAQQIVRQFRSYV